MSLHSVFMSPKREGGYVLNNENELVSPEIDENSWRDENIGEIERLRRGRPRQDTISTLVVQGAQIDHKIRCHICKRIFPREKSLQAHLRTHTGERPYVCDYPGCEKSFCQSGQLKTHQRLHTGEKPFVCSSSGCNSRFTHANRHCPYHPLSQVKREPVPIDELTPNKKEERPEVIAWFEKYKIQRQDSTPQRPLPKLKHTGTKRSLSIDIENQWAQSNKRQARCASAPDVEMKEVTNTHMNVTSPRDENCPDIKENYKYPESPRHFKLQESPRATLPFTPLSPMCNNHQVQHMYSSPSVNTLTPRHSRENLEERHTPFITPQKLLNSRSTPMPAEFSYPSPQPTPHNSPCRRPAPFSSPITKTAAASKPAPLPSPVSKPLAVPLDNCVGRVMNFGVSEARESSQEHNEKIMGALALMQLAGNQLKA